jgi:hypothetical protein
VVRQTFLPNEADSQRINPLNPLFFFFNLSCILYGPLRSVEGLAMQHDTHELPEFIVDELRRLPRFADRRALASAISRFIFPVSHRTLEAWPVRWRRVNGHAVAETREAFTHAWCKFCSSPVVTGGRGSRER